MPLTFEDPEFAIRFVTNLSLSKLLYNIFLVLYAVGVRITALWGSKARKWIAGRKGLFNDIHLQLQNSSRRSIWMHCASLGEFEQGRPLLEKLKLYYPGYPVILSFFSPSGYEVMKNYTGADHVFYLPMDSKTNAKKFIEAVNPSLVLWVKYEYWFYYLDELRLRNIPVILVSGVFRDGQPFFRFYGGIWRKMLSCFSHFFVQNEMSAALLEEIHIDKNITLNGDTRFDRVLDIARNFEPVQGINNFCGNEKVIVAGSTWEEDEIELKHYIKTHPAIRFIIAPHEINRIHLQELKKEFPEALFYSSFIKEKTALINHRNLLIIDNVGMLSRIYKYATITYVGGGFGKEGVHNVLEAAVYGKPVVFGPAYGKFLEAVGLVQAGGAISFDYPMGLEEILDGLIENEAALKKMGAAAKNFVSAQEGATDKIIHYIQENRLLTN